MPTGPYDEVRRSRAQANASGCRLNAATTSRQGTTGRGSMNSIVLGNHGAGGGEGWSARCVGGAAWPFVVGGAPLLSGASGSVVALPSWGAVAVFRMTGCGSPCAMLMRLAHGRQPGTWKQIARIAAISGIARNRPTVP